MNQSKPHYNKLKRYWKFLLNIEEDLNDMSGRPMPSDVSAIAADIAEEFPGVYDCMPFLRFHGWIFKEMSSGHRDGSGGGQRFAEIDRKVAALLYRSESLGIAEFVDQSV